MLIDTNILIAYGGVARKVEKGCLIFLEGDDPYFYYQVMEGEVKVYTSNTEGKDIIQGFFTSGESFGEPPLLLGKKYPCSAIALKRSILIKIRKEKLLNIINDFPEIAIKLIYKFAERIYNKATVTQILISQRPEEKILFFFSKIKDNRKERQLIPLTRQQIADNTGLRVETVIRTLLRMNTEGKIKIIGHKVYY